MSVSWGLPRQVRRYCRLHTGVLYIAGRAREGMMTGMCWLSTVKRLYVVPIGRAGILASAHRGRKIFNFDGRLSRRVEDRDKSRQ